MPQALPLPFAPEPLDLAGIPVATDRLAAAIVAVTRGAAVSWLFHRTRTGVALRALADDQPGAMTAGVDGTNRPVSDESEYLITPAAGGAGRLYRLRSQ